MVCLFMTIYTEQVNEHPVGCTQRTCIPCMLQLILFGVWLTYITSALERKLKSSPLLRSTCKTFFQFLGIHAKATTLWRRSALLFDVYSFSLAVACFQSVSYTSRPVKRFQMKSKGCRDACVQHTGLYTAHKQEGTIALHGAQTSSTRHIFPSIPTSVVALHV